MKFNEAGLSKYINLDKWGISSFGLKMIAAVTMLIDHTAVILVSDRIPYLIMRTIGRISFPVFCFLLVEGYFHTKSKVKHCINLIVFALLSEVPYDLITGSIFSMGKQNVIFTLLIGFLVIWALDWIFSKEKTDDNHSQNMGMMLANRIMAVIVVFIGCVLAFLLRTTYSYRGIFLIVSFYVFHNKHIGRTIGNIFFNVALYPKGIQWFGVSSVAFLELYNGKRGKWKWKYFFYIFYPLHILVLVIIRKLCW